jgi:hypothetical protein
MARRAARDRIHVQPGAVAILARAASGELRLPVFAGWRTGLELAKSRFRSVSQAR